MAPQLFPSERLDCNYFMWERHPSLVHRTETGCIAKSKIKNSPICKSKVWSISPFTRNETSLPHIYRRGKHLGCDGRPVLRHQHHLVLLARHGVSQKDDHRNAIAFRAPCWAEGALPLPTDTVRVLGNIFK